MKVFNNMKKNYSVIMALILALLLGMCSIVEAAAGSSTFEPMVIQVGSATQDIDTDGFFTLVNEASKRVSEATGGAVRFEYLGNGQLGNDSELAEAIKLGTIDAAIISVPLFASSVPSCGIFDMPYIFTSGEKVFDFIDNSQVVKKIEAQIEEQYNATPIGWAHNGFRHALNNVRPIKTVADFSGIKIRVMEGPVYMELFNRLGANPTPMSISECITGLEQGTVDGMDHPISASYGVGGYKLVKYFDLTTHTTAEAVFVINSDVFNSLTSELQEIMRKVGMEVRPIQREKLQAQEEGMLKEIEAYGVKVGRDVDMLAIQEVLKPMYTEYRENLDPVIFDEAMEYLGITIK